MERFVQAIVAGGVALVAGLWIATTADAWTEPWALGIGLVVVGVGGLAAGIGHEIDF